MTPGLEVRTTNLRVMMRKEQPVYEPSRADIWAGLVIFAGAGTIGLFALFGMGVAAHRLWLALELFLHRMGLVG